MNNFKTRVKALCTQNGISQKFASESTGHGQYFLNDVWQGKRAMSDEDYNALAQALHTTPAYLKGETDDPKLPGEPETWTVPNWVGEIKKDPRKEGIVQRMAEMKVEDLLKLEKIMDMILGEK